MTDGAENLILQILGDIRTDIAELRSDVATIKGDLSDVDQKVDGLAVIMTMLAGHVHHIDERVEVLEGKAK